MSNTQKTPDLEKETKEEKKFKKYLLEKIEYLKNTKDNKCFDLIDLNMAIKRGYNQAQKETAEKVQKLKFEILSGCYQTNANPKYFEKIINKIFKEASQEQETK